MYERIDFFIPVNMQNPPKPHATNWYVRMADDNSIPENTVEGYEFTLDKRADSFGIAEGSDPELNYRSLFLPEEGHYFVSRDFSGQELRIVANLANETNWIKEFNEGDADPHKITAELIWGKENYNRDYRKKAKVINFGIIYGKTEKSLSSDLKVSEEEAKQYLDGFLKGLPAIARYMQSQVNHATNNKEVQNYYGRKRRFVNFFNRYGQLSNEGRNRAFNFPIQSMGGEVTKIALIKVYNELINSPEFIDKVYFMSTIHDEINLSIDKSVIKEAAYKMGLLMDHEIPNMPVPIITALEIGHSMGVTWKFNQDPVTLELVPVYDPL